MDDRWRRIEELFHRALEEAPGKRRAFLARACGGDGELLAEVESLLDAGDATLDFLDQPAIDPAHVQALISTIIRRDQTTVVVPDTTGPATPKDKSPVPARQARPAGTVIDEKYRIDAVAGEGGMGTVFRATQLNLGRPVALKLMREDLAPSPHNLEQFRLEALAIARLKHPHIVTIHDIGTSGSAGAYIVMEFLEGESLHDAIQREGRLTPDRAIELMRQICSGVQAAHEAGVLHRDLKPANILLEIASGGPWAKVVDFGIAELQGLTDTVSTMGGRQRRLLGTPHYMSPEQCNGEPADGRSDVYALGCILYQMLTGHPPFNAVNQTLAGLLDAHRQRRPRPPSWEVPEIPAVLDAAVLRALAKAPEERFQTAAEFDAALASVLLTPKHNLPQSLTSFVGSEALVGDLRDRLYRLRLMTFTGPGGIGKTRFALETATQSIDRYPDGVWFVEFGDVAAAERVPRTIARVLQIREEANQPVEETIVNAIQSRKLLLVLDNCEHVIEAAASIAASCLRAVPGLRILATSREPLGIAGETVWPVPTLALPADTASSPEDIAEIEAVRLFVDRARRGRPDFALSNRNARTVAALCAQLEGIPLAIELAAARMRVLTVEQILARMTDRFRVLSRGASTVETRQRTLRATMDWSHDLLTESERTLFRRLAVFTGGCTLAAAEAVCADGHALSKDIPDLLRRLVEKSLILAPSRGGETRFRMLETIREYARGKLEASPDLDATIDAHLEWFARFAAEGDAGVRGDGRAVWLDRFETDHDNVRAALEQAGARGGGTPLLELAVQVAFFWRIHGYFAEGRAWMERALDHAGNADPALREQALNHAGVFAYYQGELEAASRFLERSVALCRETNQPIEAARRLYNLGAIRNALGDYDRAMRLYTESLRLFEELGDEAGHARALNGLGLLSMDTGDFQHARELFEESLARARAGGDRRSIASAFHNLGSLGRREKRLDVAEALLNECMSLAVDLDDRQLVASCTYGLGTVELDRGHFDSAGQLLGQALDANRELDARDGIALVLEAFACLAAARGEAERAMTIAGSAEALRDAITFPMHPSEHALLHDYLDRARSALGPLQAEVAFEHGRQRSLESMLDTLRKP